jgi:hypothetical protein
VKREGRDISKPGLLLACAMIVAGTLAVLLAPEIWVTHPRIRGYGSPAPPVEKVTSGTARLYGGALILVGIGIAVFSVHRPRE